MKTAPRISIITPSYNQAEYLEECIDSILSQNYPNLEYIVMDGGSTDGSVEIIRKYEKYLSYWQSCPDGGQYAAINDGFARSTGEIMAWLNSDDKYHPNAFLKAACTFTEHPEVSWITGFRTTWDGKGAISALESGIPYFSRKKFLSGNWGNPCIQQESTFWRRSLWMLSGGGLNTACNLAADAELWLRFFRHSPLYYVKAFLGGFRLHGNQRSLLQMQTYIAEIKHAVEQELYMSAEKNDFISMPPPLCITSSAYIAFAHRNGIPRFQYPLSQTGQKYVKTFYEWVQIVAKGPLELAEIFAAELSLWDENMGEVKVLNKQLKRSLEEKKMAVGLIHQGEEYYKAGKMEEALKAMFEALDIWPTSAEGMSDLAVILQQKGMHVEAINYLTQATQCDPSLPQLYRNLATILFEIGKRSEAKFALEFYLARYPDDVEMDSFYRRLMSWA